MGVIYKSLTFTPSPVLSPQGRGTHEQSLRVAIHTLPTPQPKVMQVPLAPMGSPATRASKTSPSPTPFRHGKGNPLQQTSPPPSARKVRERGTTNPPYFPSPLRGEVRVGVIYRGWVGVIYKSLTFTPSPVLLTPFGQASAKDCFIDVTAKSHSKHCYSSRHKEPTELFVSCEPPQGRGTHEQSLRVAVHTLPTPQPKSLHVPRALPLALTPVICL